VLILSGRRPSTLRCYTALVLGVTESLNGTSNPTRTLHSTGANIFIAAFEYSEWEIGEITARLPICFRTRVPL